MRQSLFTSQDTFAFLQIDGLRLCPEGFNQRDYCG